MTIRRVFDAHHECTDSSCPWYELTANIAQSEALLLASLDTIRRRERRTRLIRSGGFMWPHRAVLWSLRYLLVEKALRAALIWVINH